MVTLGSGEDFLPSKWEALDGKTIRWSFEEAVERRQVINQVYERPFVVMPPNTYTYFSLRDEKKLCTTHTELNRNEFAALEQSLYN
jgi:hypothetical protein